MRRLVDGHWLPLSLSCLLGSLWIALSAGFVDIPWLFPGAVEPWSRPPSKITAPPAKDVVGRPIGYPALFLFVAVCRCESDAALARESIRFPALEGHVIVAHSGDGKVTERIDRAGGHRIRIIAGRTKSIAEALRLDRLPRSYIVDRDGTVLWFESQATRGAQASLRALRNALQNQPEGG